MQRTAKFRLLLVAFIVAAFSGHASAKSKLVDRLESKKKQVIVAYGTSLTAGGAWVSQLSDALNQRFPGLATVINSGGSGMWSKWGIDNLDKRVISKKPDVVFIEFCINDSVERFHCTVAKSKANLETMITRILKSNPRCEIFLMTMTPGDKYPQGHRSHRKGIATYYAMYQSVAKKRGLLLIDHYSSWKKLQSRDPKLFQKYVPDTIHPTAAGCANVVTPRLLQALGLKK